MILSCEFSTTLQEMQDLLLWYKMRMNTNPCFSGLFFFFFKRQLVENGSCFCLKQIKVPTCSVKCWSVGKMEAWKKIPNLHILMRGSQQHKLFCFATVLIIQTITADMNILGHTWCFIRSVAGTKYKTRHYLAYLTEICWWKNMKSYSCHSIRLRHTSWHKIKPQSSLCSSKRHPFPLCAWKYRP